MGAKETWLTVAFNEIIRETFETIYCFFKITSMKPGCHFVKVYDD